MASAATPRQAIAPCSFRICEEKLRRYAAAEPRRIVAIIVKCAYCRGHRGYVPSQMKRT